MYPGSQRGAASYSRPAGPGGAQKASDTRCGTPSTTPSTVPSLTTLASSQQFQWMVQPTVMSSSTSAFYPTPYSYPYPELGSAPGTSCGPRSGVIRSIRHHLGGRRRKEEELSPEEEERKKQRRERNKIAAAKCRNRRRELTDWLQTETDELEDKKSLLQKEIADLQKEKERLEFVLEAHQPICKIAEDCKVDSALGVSGGHGAKVKGSAAKPPSSRRRPPDVSIPPTASLGGRLEAETLHTPTLVKTPSITPFTASLAFTYPSVPPYDPEPSAGASGSGASIFSPPEPCAVAHRRSSSSGDQSSDSLSSPTLVTL